MKKILLSALMLFLFVFSNAQENKLIMSGDVEAHMSNNVKIGKAAEDGVLSIFVISYQERALKEQEKDGIISSLQKIEGFKNLEIKYNDNTFLITTLKKRRSPQYPEIKAILAELGFRIIKSEEKLELAKS